MSTVKLEAGNAVTEHDRVEDMKALVLFEMSYTCPVNQM